MTELMFRRDELPAKSELIVWDELIIQCDCPPELLLELVEMGWLKPSQSTSSSHLYNNTDVYKIRKLARICHDLELPLIGGTIIVDLLKRVHDLETTLASLNK